MDSKSPLDATPQSTVEFLCITFTTAATSCQSVQTRATSPKRRVSRHGARSKPSWLNRTRRAKVSRNSCRSLYRCLIMAFVVSKYYDKAQTPWVWQPRDLDDEDQDSPSQEQGSDDPSGQSRRNSGGTTDEPESFTARRELQPTFSINIVRTPEHYRHLSSGSLPSTPSRGSSRGSMDIVPARMSQLSIGSSGGSQGSIGSSNPNSSDFPSSSSILGGDQLSDEPSSILSPLIIAHTPKPATRGLRNHYTHPLINSGGLDPIPESTIDPRAAPTRQAPIGHASSLPILSTSQGYAVAQPSPLRDDDRERREKRDRKDRKDKKERPDHHDWRGLGSKHTTFIDPYTSNVYSSNPTRSPPQNHSPATASSHSTPSSQSSQPSPSYPATHASSPSSYSPGPSPPQRKSKQSPPDDNRALHPQSSPATAKSIKPETSTLHGQQIPVQPPPLFVKRPSFETYDNRRRRGYWNRRGDHLTQSGYIVYAPPGKQFPQELRNYPTEDEGYENHDNLFTANTARPELPESLARGGKPPEKPYDSVSPHWLRKWFAKY